MLVFRLATSTRGAGVWLSPATSAAELRGAAISGGGEVTFFGPATSDLGLDLELDFVGAS